MNIQILFRMNWIGLGNLMYRLTNDIERLPFPMAPVESEGVTALEEMSGRKESWRWQVFSIGSVIGSLFGLVYIVPLTVYTTYGIVTEITGGRLPVAYVVTLFAMGFTAVSYARMAAAFPVAGSAYTYTQKAFGARLGFLTGWSLLLDCAPLGLSAEQAAVRLLPAARIAATAMAGWGSPDTSRYLRFVFANEPCERLRGMGARVRAALA